MQLRVGMRVLVKNLGEAIVSRVTRDGAIVALQSAGGLNMQMSYHQLQPMETNPLTNEGENRMQTQVDAKEAAGLKALEALRFGVVPDYYINEITIGYDDLKKWIIHNLPHVCADKPCIYEISGPFGTGKSHTMAVMRHVAVEEGYLTARIEVDGENISLAYPEKLLYNLWLTLQGSDYKPEYPLLDLYLKLIQKGYDNVPPSLKNSELFKENFNLKFRTP